MTTELGKISWFVLNDLLAAGKRFYESAAREKKAQQAASAPAGSFGRRKRRKLKEREPW